MNNPDDYPTAPNISIAVVELTAHAVADPLTMEEMMVRAKTLKGVDTRHVRVFPFREMMVRTTLTFCASPRLRVFILSVYPHDFSRALDGVIADEIAKAFFPEDYMRIPDSYLVPIPGMPTPNKYMQIV